MPITKVYLPSRLSVKALTHWTLWAPSIMNNGLVERVYILAIHSAFFKPNLSASLSILKPLSFKILIASTTILALKC